MKQMTVFAGIVIVAMLAMAPAASSGNAFLWMGNVTYCNDTSTPVPAGWHVYMENLNHSEFAGQPWHFMTDNFWPWNAHSGGEMDSDDDWIYVNVTNHDGYVGEFTTRLGDIFDTSTGAYIKDFYVHETPMPFAKDLAPGWNLVSLPRTPEDIITSAVLVSINGKYDSVMKYTPATGFVEVTTMDPGIGYFIHMTEAGTWSYDGYVYESMSVSLSPGLNMVGWVNSDTSLPDALDSIDGSYRYVARWNTTEQKYEVYDPIAPDGFNDFDTMEGGVGYFIAATAECTLGYP